MFCQQYKKWILSVSQIISLVHSHSPQLGKNTPSFFYTCKNRTVRQSCFPRISEWCLENVSLCLLKPNLFFGFFSSKKIIKKKLGKKRLEINPNYAKCWSAHAVSSRTWAVFLCEEPGIQVLAVVSYLVLWLKWLPYFQGVVMLYQQQLPQVTLVYNKAQLLLQPATSKQIRLQQAFKKGMCT